VQIDKYYTISLTCGPEKIKLTEEESKMVVPGRVWEWFLGNVGQGIQNFS
jgi:hypothetical protein